MDLTTANFQAPTGYPPHVWTEQEKADLTTALKTVATKEGRFMDNACAHEFADRPPPTEADYERLDAALTTIFNKRDSKMTEATTVDMNEVTAKSAEAATQLLKQDGWAIVRELHAAALDSINQTGLVVLPIMSNLDDYKLILKDPSGFEQRFETLTNDIAMVMVTAKALGERSEGKSGTPTQEDIDLISSLTMDYTKVHGYIERTIQPLILVLIDELEAAGVTNLNV